MPGALGELVENLFRREAGRIVARLVRRLGPGRLQLAEDLAQEALLRALDSWSWRGIPENPAAWLQTVAHRLAIDAVRRQATLQRLLPALEADALQAASPPAAIDADAIEDDELQLLFLCADPQLTAEMRVPLMLNVACGFSAAEIARGLLRAESSVAQTLVRAKRRLRRLDWPRHLPDADQLATRLGAVIEALHLMFSEGYEASSGDALMRAEFCVEALRLGELLAGDPRLASPQIRALAAWFCFQAARLPARVDGNGELVPLPAQDRSRWDRALIDRGWWHLQAAGQGGELSEHHLLAAIAAEHIRAASFAATDWDSLQQFYDLLIAVAPSPVHCLNRAVIVLERVGPAAALAEIRRLADIAGLARFHLYHATHAEILLRLGRQGEAAAALRAALQTSPPAPARRLLQRRLDALAFDPASGQ